MMKAEAAGSLPKTNAEAVRKKPGRKRYGWMKGLLLPAVIIAIWQVIGGLGVVSATVLPTPVTIVLTFKELILSGELFGHLQISIYRAALGFLLGAGLGLMIGILADFPNGRSCILIRRCKCLEPYLIWPSRRCLFYGSDLTKYLKFC